MKHWPVLENNRALLHPGWLPPEDVWPELGELREEHLRLLAAREQAVIEAVEVQHRHEAEDADRSTEIKTALLDGDGLADAEGTPSDERSADLTEARLRVEAATDALVEFLTMALAEVTERAPDWYARLDAHAAEVEAKREEARRLLAEADQNVGGVQRMRHWLDRESGKSPLGHYPFDQMPVPQPSHEPDLLQVLSGGATTEVVHA